jgi:hypothetical protein
MTERRPSCFRLAVVRGGVRSELWKPPRSLGRRPSDATLARGAARASVLPKTSRSSSQRGGSLEWAYG